MSSVQTLQIYLFLSDATPIPRPMLSGHSTHYNPPLYIILVFVFHSLEIMEVKKINGYRILISQVLGQGASGTVYRGIQDETKLECAIKVVDKRILSKDLYRQSAMESEIQIMAKLKSVNIVGFLDVLVSHNNYYIVQELCESDLDKYLAEHRKIQEPTAIKFLTEICNGFLALVKQGIVHRDLKPANILISKGVLKIGDFGFAKVNAHKKILNVTTVGTPLYMSQEVLRAQHYTSKCDIWSLGFIFYQMLHGKTPWTAKSECELLQNLRTQPLTIDSGLGTDTRDFLQQCLKFHEEERISWDSVFKHPIFGGYFDAYTSQNMELEDKYKKVMSDLRFQVNCQNIDLETLWRQLGLKEGKDIKFNQFQQFLEAINTSMSEWEQRFFFQKLDPQGRGEVSLAHLGVQLEKYSISTTSRHRKGLPMGLRQVRTLGGWGEGLEQKVRACFQKMHKILSSKGVSLSKTFVIYDRDSSGELTVDELAKIMLKLDPSFREEEIQAVFELIDEDGSHSIKFEELDSYYRRVNGLGEGAEGKENGGS